LYIAVLIWHHVYYSIKHIGYETSNCRNPSIQFYRRQKKPWPILNRPTLKHVLFLWKYKKKLFLDTRFLIEGVFVTQLANNEGISVWRIVWVTTNCCIMGHILKCHILCYYHYTVINLVAMNLHHRQLGILIHYLQREAKNCVL